MKTNRNQGNSDQVQNSQNNDQRKNFSPSEDGEMHGSKNRELSGSSRAENIDDQEDQNQESRSTQSQSGSPSEDTNTQRSDGSMDNDAKS
jgi:hypothetical protein